MPQALLRAARGQIGRASPPAGERLDISRANLEYLRLELDKLRAEKVGGEPWTRCSRRVQQPRGVGFRRGSIQ
jgi:hypothetical protein